jgi:DNA (cytosine-5)-methyltransferase 1
MSKQYNAIDLFSGGGGLTTGMKLAGFKVTGAVEIEPNAIATYKANHPEVKVFAEDIREISGDQLRMTTPEYKIDLLAGCPPCQGFSSLTHKYKKPDMRNELILEFGRLVKETMPRVIMMENVPGLSKRGKRLFDEFVTLITKLGYIPSHKILQVADYGVPQNRRRLVLIAGYKFKIELPATTHNRNGDGGLPNWVTVGEALDVIKKKPVTLIASWLKGGPKEHNWHVIRNMSETNRQRLKNARVGRSWKIIPKRLRPMCHKDKKSGFSNVYGKMSRRLVSPTITGGCTTLSKGRFGHPCQLRTISVREAALLQTFPKDYIIDTDFMDHACNIIGNALPCLFAEKLSIQCFNALSAHGS